MPKPIPDRWIPYTACGRIIEGTRIICFKVPLKKSVQVGNSEIKEIWDIKALFEKIPNLAAVIDLTNTSRYYDPRELQSARAGILYQKILIPGHIVPPEDKVQLFMDTVDEFLGKDCVAVQVKKARLGLPTAESLIGVHCTHGLNRTGYMVCRYMRDRLNIPAQTAIKRFEKARGYQIERDNYIADLLGEKQLPADTGRFTNVRPISDRGKDRGPSIENEDEGGSTRRGTLRTEGGDTTRYAWNKDKAGENSQSRKKKTDSESSYDFRSRSAEEISGGKIDDDRKKRKQDKKIRKRREKLEKKEEDKKRRRKDKKKLRKVKKKNKVTEMTKTEPKARL